MRWISYINYLIIIILINALLLPNVSANPLPVTIVERGTLPVPDSETPLILKSEEILFRITKHVIGTANFTIYNPSNNTVFQPILFPIYRSWEYVYRYEGYHPFDILNLSVNGTNIPWSRSELESYEDAILFNISVQPYEELVVHIKFKTHYQQTIHHGRSFRYITLTGKEWNHPIEHAYFKFVFEDGIVGGDLKGGDEVHRNGTSWITTIERFNWIPEKNIKITWKIPSYYTYYSKPRVFLISPSYWDHLDHNIVTLEWYIHFINKNNETVFYDVYLGHEYNDVLRRLDSTCIAKNITNRSITVRILMGYDYYWKVVAYRGDLRDRDESMKYLRTYTDYTPKVRLLTPENNLVSFSNSVNLSWRNFKGKDHWMLYDVYIDTDVRKVVGYDEAVLVSKDQTETYYMIDGLEEGKTYYWTVVPYDGIYGECLNDTWCFEIWDDAVIDNFLKPDEGHQKDPDRTSKPADISKTNIWITSIIIPIIIITVIVIFLFKRSKDN
jgi:hypothetical protein